MQATSWRLRYFPMRKSLYMLTALVAFSLGLSLGLAIPVYMSLDLTSITNATVSRVPRSSQEDFPSVSFLSDNTIEDTRPSGFVEGIFWGDEVEASLPTGYGDPEAERWRRYIRSNNVIKIEEGCGRMQNRMLTFEDGTKACCRYRQNTDQIQGELFSFYLGRLLGLTNLAPSALGIVQSRDPVWSKVRSQMNLAQWNEGRAVVLTKYVDELGPALIPKNLRTPSRKLHPQDVEGDKERLIELAQWSDLIVFDYLTANLDRVVNNLYNLQWNPGMMDAPAHNLAKSTKSNLLVFLDNESGLLHGYRLLDKYESYHSVLLNALCVFRRSTIDMVEKLRRTVHIGDLLNTRLSLDRDAIPGIPDKSARILKDRLNRVHDQVEWCKKQYPR